MDIRRGIQRTVTSSPEPEDAGPDRGRRRLDEQGQHLASRPQRGEPSSAPRRSGRPSLTVETTDDTRPVVAAIRNAVPGPHATRPRFYEAILQANAQRPDDDKWSEEDMASAARIGPGTAAAVRRLLEPDSPTSEAIRDRLDEGIQPLQGDESESARYLRALDHEAAGAGPWPVRSMRKAAGILPAAAFLVEQASGRPPLLHPLASRDFMDETAPGDQDEFGADAYRRALPHQAILGWNQGSMAKSAGISPGRAHQLSRNFEPDSPTTAAVRAFLDQGQPGGGRVETARARYLRALDHNEALDPGQQWPNASLIKAAGILQADSVRARAQRQRHRLADSNSAVLSMRQVAPAGDSKNARYRSYVDANGQRPADQKWSEADMRLAAEFPVARTSAERPSDIQGQRPGLTQEIAQFLDAGAPAGAPDNGPDRYRRALERNDAIGAAMPWPDTNMREAAGVNPTTASKIRWSRAPDSPRTVAARNFMDASASAGEGNGPVDRYLRGRQRNEAVPAAQRWPERSLERAAGIGPNPARRARAEAVARQQADPSAPSASTD